MDIADRAEKQEQKNRDAAIKHITTIGVHKDGPVVCVKCGETNDRRREGFAVCSDCVEAVNDK